MYEYGRIWMKMDKNGWTLRRTLRSFVKSRFGVVWGRVDLQSCRARFSGICSRSCGWRLRCFKQMPTQTVEDGAWILPLLPMFGCVPDLACLYHLSHFCLGPHIFFPSNSAAPAWKRSWHLPKASSQVRASTGGRNWTFLGWFIRHNSFSKNAQPRLA